MFSRNQQKKFLRKNRKRIIFHLVAFCENNDAEDLHKMRVALKKLKAFIYFLSKTTKLKHLPNLLVPVKAIFKHAGDIRNAQVNIELAKNFHLTNKRFCTAQEKIIEGESVRFWQRAEVSISTIERTVVSIFPYLKDVKTRRVVKFFRKEIKKSDHRLQKDLNTEEWHSFRKKIKIILYAYKLSGGSAEQKIYLNLLYLDDLQESIGKWHDIVMASDLIHQQTKPAKLLTQKLIHQSVAQKKELIAKVEGFTEKSAQQ
jgi:CHAD domain-containing protein